MRKIILLNENGFCYGVNRAIKIVENAINNKDLKKPIYILGNLIHNTHLNEYFKEKQVIVLDGISRLEMISSIKAGTVIFTAHGVSEQVKSKAKELGLDVVDATCPYVNKMFFLMKKYAYSGYKVYFLGKKNHPEVEVALSLGDNVSLIENIEKTDRPVCLAHQTTMSSYDVLEEFKNIKKIIPHIELLPMVCKETENRQNSIKSLLNITMNDPSLIIVVGDKISNNSSKLYEMAKRLNKSDVLFISKIDEINLLELKKYKEIRLIGGTSTPLSIILEIKEVLEHLDDYNTSTVLSSLSSVDYIK